MTNNDTTPIGPNSIDEQRQGHQRDLVFNAEMCRAIRRGTQEFGRVAIVIVTAMSSLILPITAGALSLSPMIGFVVRVVASFVAAAVIVTVVRVVGLWPDQEARRELRQCIDDLQAGGLYGALKEDEDDPPAVPALAAGRSGFEWIVVLGVPLMLLFREGISDVATPLLLGGCAIGIVLFLLGPLNTNTYPVDDPPDGGSTTDDSSGGDD